MEIVKKTVSLVELEKENRNQFLRELAGCLNHKGRYEGEQWCFDCHLSTCINFKGLKGDELVCLEE